MGNGFDSVGTAGHLRYQRGVRGLNPVIIFFKKRTYIFRQLHWKVKNKEKLSDNGLFKTKIKQYFIISEVSEFQTWFWRPLCRKSLTS